LNWIGFIVFLRNVDLIELNEKGEIMTEKTGLTRKMHLLIVL